MKRILLIIMTMIFIQSCRFKDNYDKYAGYWEIRKVSEIEVLEIRKDGKDYTYKIYSVNKSASASEKDWKEAGDVVKISEKESGKLIKKYGGLYTEKDLEKAKAEIEKFNGLSSEEQKEFLVLSGNQNMKINEKNLAMGYYFMYGQLHYFTKHDKGNGDAVYLEKFSHYDKVDESIVSFNYEKN